MKKIIGLVSFLIAIGMLIMLIAHNRLIGMVIIALLPVSYTHLTLPTT